ncbi:hypothetical protein LOTGIDRAFT_174207 [Lottia gigantea]|uniref:Arrestin C-terminal-like domain-containing protein n=1 Tax=Lottia gigantea TaxID=225164 RepID=V4AY54_LOTGI|nr:hypothetical protein LOTGIDRAFT_174207 [Lottia gigantea]ESO98521.1 hypothetical protein LOTGIDRAFT_174207 [Lottia gigantea]
MTNVEDLTVQFVYDDTSERQFYLPGDPMKGIITIYLKGTIRVRAIEFLVTGVGAVSWEIPNRKKLFTCRETYLEGAKNIVNDLQGREVTLAKGAHEFHFTYQLPTNLPSSYNGVYGSVTYTAKITLECESERDNMHVSEPFLFLRRPPLPMETLSVKEMKDSRFYVGFCKTGQVKVNCTLSQTGGIPGEEIAIDADVMNWSPREILVIQASIIMQSCYYARGESITFRQVINKREDPYDFDNRKGRRWRSVLIAIPPYIADTDLKFCNLMDVCYFFQFRVAVSGKEDIILECPIQVGGRPHGMEMREGRAFGQSNVDTKDINPFLRDAARYAGDIDEGYYRRR